MFEQIIDKRYKEAVSIVEGLRDFSAERIILSSLSDFTKAFIVNDGTKYNSRAELLKIIEKSVKLNLNYCLRPKWTLLNYIYGSYDSRATQEICKKTDIFTYYTFYTESIKELCSDENYVSVPRPIIENLITQINKDIHDKLTTNTTSLKIKNFFLQVFKLKYGDGSEISLDMSIPFSLIKLFLEDKGFDDVLNMFTEAGCDNGDNEIELKTIIKIITGRIKDVKLPGVGFAEESSKADTKDNVSVPLTENNNTHPEGEEIKSGFESTFKVTAPAGGYVNSFEDTSTKEEQPELPKISEEFVEREELGEKHLRFYFKEEEIKAVSKKIFKGDKYKLLDTLLEIENLKSWREATEYLKTIFINNKVNIGDKNVIMFVDVLNEYFEKR